MRLRPTATHDFDSRRHVDIDESLVVQDGQVMTFDEALNKWRPTNPSDVTEHGALTGLTDDDHPQYARADHSHVPESPTVKKLADESVASSVTLQDDDHLKFTGDANSTYVVELLIFYEGATAGDLKLTIDGPTGVTGGWTSTGVSGNVGYNVGTGAGSSMRALGTAASWGAAGVGSLNMLQAIAYVTVGSTAGDVKVQWAQDASNATATTLKKGSLLRYTKVA